MKKKDTKLIKTFQAMEAAGELPLFDDFHDEIELRGTLPDSNPEDMGVIRVVNVAVSLNNCLAAINFARTAIETAFPGEPDVRTTMNAGIAGAMKHVKATQVLAMKAIATQVKKYAKTQAKRKPAVQKYEKTYSKTKVVS